MLLQILQVCRRRFSLKFFLQQMQDLALLLVTGYSDRSTGAPLRSTLIAASICRMRSTNFCRRSSLENSMSKTLFGYVGWKTTVTPYDELSGELGTKCTV